MVRVLQAAFAAMFAIAPLAEAVAQRRTQAKPQVQMVTADNPASIVSALQAFGYRAQIGKDDVGNPKIVSGSGGKTNFEIYFYGCTNNANCATVQFYAGYNKRNKVTHTWLNDWNSRKRFVRAYLTASGESHLEMDVDLNLGGIDEVLFLDLLNLWETQQSAFEMEINAK